MSRVTAFLGSPRRNGNTGQIVDKLMEGIRLTGNETEVIHLSEYRLSGCRGCLACMETGKCVLVDDMALIYPRIEQSDAYLYASCTYNYNVTSEMKALLDRMLCYYRFQGTDCTSRLGDTKKALLIGVCAGPGSAENKIVEDNMGFTIPAMRLPLADLGICTVKEIRYYNTKRYPLEQNKLYQKELLQIGTDFGKLIINDEDNKLLRPL